MTKNLSDQEFKERVGEVLRKELHNDLTWHYISFADKVFKGGVFIQAQGITDALMKINLLGINPGGEVISLECPDEFLPKEEDRNRLLNKKDILRIWPDAKSLGELEEEEE